MTEEETETIRRLCETAPSTDRVYNIDIVDGEGEVHATVEKTIYVRKNPPATGGGP